MSHCLKAKNLPDCLTTLVLTPQHPRFATIHFAGGLSGEHVTDRIPFRPAGSFLPCAILHESCITGYRDPLPRIARSSDGALSGTTLQSDGPVADPVFILSEDGYYIEYIGGMEQQSYQNGNPLIGRQLLDVLPRTRRSG